jgi:hypothetical protein
MARSNQDIRLEYDHAARVTKLIENFRSDESGLDKNKTTGFLYSPDSRLKQVIAKNSASPGDQVTE